jgi:outer membrane protein TolC
VRDRYAAGLAVQQDVLRAEVEVARLDEELASQRAAIAAKSAELHRLIGRPIDAGAPLPERAEVPPAAEVIASVLARSPELAAAAQSIETGRIAITLAKKNFLPDFVVSAGSMYRGSFDMGPMWQAGIGVTIPAWIDRRQRNQLAEAVADAEGREAEREVVARELELRTRERLAQLDAADDVAALYRDKILPLDDLALESALASYRTGKLPFVSVLDALNALYSDRALYLGRLAESAKWRVAIDEGQP